MNNILRISWLSILATLSGLLCMADDNDKLPTVYTENVLDSRLKAARYGYLGSDGEVITDPIFEKAYPFSSNGIALVKKGPNFGYIDTKGQYILNGLREARPFDEFNRAAVKRDKKWGLINSEMFIILKDVFDRIEPFQSNGLAIVKYENKFGLVDTLGNVVLPVIYDKVENFDKSGYAYIKDGNSFGIVDKRGRAVIPAEHKDKKLAMAALTEIKSKMARPDLSLADVAKINNVTTTENVQDPSFPPEKDEEQLRAAAEKAEMARQEEERQQLLAEKAREEEQSRIAAEKAEKARMEEQQRQLAEKARKEEEQKLLAEKERKEEEQKLLAEQARKEEEQKLLDENARKEEEQKLLAEQARKEEEQKRREEARKRLEDTPSLKNYIAANLGDWNDFLASKNINLPSEEEVRDYIEEEVSKWQIKGEFEPTAKWKERVNETTRSAKINAIADSIFSINSKALEAVQDEYRKAYESLADRYCSGIAEQFVSQNLVIKPYDADNETFLISTDDFGDFLLSVPLDEAPGFKQEWDKWKTAAIASFVPNGDDVALKSVKIGKYTYDSDMNATYAQVDVEYNFKPVDVAQLNNRLDSGVDLAMNSSTSASRNNGIQTERKKISAGSASDVDINIPIGENTHSNTFAVVIANGEYAHASNVAHAENDGRIMAQYLTRTLGIPEKNVATFINATYGQMVSAISMLQDIGDAYQGSDFNIIFYYVGHGLPDDEAKKSYILPIDIDPRMVSICMPLEKIYADLGNLGAQNVTVMVDACFSGTNHGEGMLVPQSMGVAMKPKKASPIGNMVVLTAADGNETAFPYEEKDHGLFTYWLLKKLQETSGKVTIGELSDFVIDNVKKTSVTINRKPQTPTVATSPQLADSWRTMPFGN